MSLITPDIGLIFWTTTIFLIVLLILRAFAWKPILNAIRTRENTIASALTAAEKVRSEMAKLEAANEKIILEAKQERIQIMKEAREIKEKLIKDAREEAIQEANKLIELARQTIINERASAVNEIRKQVAVLSVEIAEKILREKLEKDKDHAVLITRLMDDIKIN